AGAPISAIPGTLRSSLPSGQQSRPAHSRILNQLLTRRLLFAPHAPYSPAWCCGAVSFLPSPIWNYSNRLFGWVNQIGGSQARVLLSPLKLSEMASPANTTQFLSENGSFQDKDIVIQTPMVTIIPASDGSPAHQAIWRCCFVEAPATFKSLRHVKDPLCEKPVI